MTNIKEQSKNNRAQLMLELGLKNIMSSPKLQKVVVNVGVGIKVKEQANLMELLQKDIAALTGQKAVITKAKKAIAGFKLQKGQPVGLKVTLRDQRMYDFLDRLVNSVFPAIRDFKGIPQSSLDRFGNLSVGLAEHTLFPEIGFEQASRAHGVQITIVPNTRDKNTALALYKSLGIPLQDAGGLNIKRLEFKEN